MYMFLEKRFFDVQRNESELEESTGFHIEKYPRRGWIGAGKEKAPGKMSARQLAFL